MARRQVGARELKTRLGAYLRQVRQGKAVIITQRGEAVAELRSIRAGRSVEAVIARLQALGAVTRAARGRLKRFRPVRIGGRPVAETIVQDRADRF